MRGFIVSDPDMGPKWSEVHQKNLTQLVKVWEVHGFDERDGGDGKGTTGIRRNAEW
jgi:hypothetical protein